MKQIDPYSRRIEISEIEHTKKKKRQILMEHQKINTLKRHMKTTSTKNRHHLNQILSRKRPKDIQ